MVVMFYKLWCMIVWEFFVFHWDKIIVQVFALLFKFLVVQQQLLLSLLLNSLHRFLCIIRKSLLRESIQLKSILDIAFNKVFSIILSIIYTFIINCFLTIIRQYVIHEGIFYLNGFLLLVLLKTEWAFQHVLSCWRRWFVNLWQWTWHWQ